jgi:transcriptional regulator with XRE-family HTH domain
VSLNFRQPLVGRRLRVLREQLGLTRAELAELTGVNASAIYRLEGGHDVRLSSYFPIIQYFATRGPRAWLLAERLALLPAVQRTEILAALDDAERDGDTHG